MTLKNQSTVEIPEALLEAIRSFPVERDVEHCGATMSVSPFDIYADCPQCGEQIKLRAFSASTEIEDVFDAVFQWLNDPRAAEAAEKRQRTLWDEVE